MMAKIEKRMMVLALVVVMAGMASTGEIKGRDVVAAGTVRTLSGTLKPEGGHDWFLITEDGTYELHLGPDKFRKAQGFKMNEGDSAEVTGFIHEEQMAPITLTVEGKTIVLRNEEGKPLWAGTEFGGKDKDEDKARPGRGAGSGGRGQGAGQNRQ